jgi:hypothetical protein
MKNKNKRELEKYWAKEAAKKAKVAKKKTSAAEKVNQAEAQADKEPSGSQSRA